MDTTSRRSKAVVFGMVSVIGLSLTANQVTLVALPWLVLEWTGKAFDAGLLAFCTGVALVGGSWLGGVLADRLGPARVAFVSDVLSGLVNGLIPLLAAFDLLSYPVLLLLASVGALLDPAGVTARESLLPQVARVGGVPLEKVNAWSEGGQGVANVVGPALGGALIAALGATEVLAISSVIFFLTALAGSVVCRGLSRPPGRSARTAWLEGWHVLRRDGVLWTLSLVGTAWLAAFAPLGAIVLPVLFHEAGGVNQLGSLLATLGLGGIAGALVYGHVLRRQSPRRVLLSGMGAAVAGWIMLGLAPNHALQLAAGFLTGFMSGVIMPLVNTIFHRRTPGHALARVLGMSTSLAMAAAPIGMLGVGVLTETFGPRATLFFLAGSLLVVWLFTTRSRALRTLDRQGA